MKILFENKLNLALLSAVNEDENYPLTNLVHPFLTRIFKSSMATDTITAIFTTPVQISSIFYGYTNSTLIIRLYTGVTLLSTLSGALSYHFSPLTVDKIEVDLTSLGGAYLGSLAVGTPYAIKPPTSYWDETFSDRSIVSEAQAGQTLQEYVEPLRRYDWRWEQCSRTVAREFEAQYVASGVGRPLWIDPETDGLNPLYCKIVDPMSVSKALRSYTTNLSFQEAR